MAQHGLIKRLVPERGFGFIEGESGDVFFHTSVLAEGDFEQLYEGQSVEYELDASAQGGKGPRASSVKPVSD